MLLNIFDKITATFFVFICVIFLVGCQKEINVGSAGNLTQADLITKVNSSVSGFVTDENNLAVLGAAVSAGGIIINTDKYGYFEINNAAVVKNAAAVIVSRAGYFNGYKTFIAIDGGSTFLRIKLITKTISGSLNGAAGGTLNLPNGSTLFLPSNALIDVSTGQVYTGIIKIFFSQVSPAGSDISKLIPGDSRGLNTEGAIKVLTSYSMAAMELTGSAGELLQMATGKKITLSFLIPSTLLSNAPASLPLWYFDELIGLWKQQGFTKKNGNFYTGELGNFSYWNCGLPLSDAVNFSCKVMDAAGHSLQGAKVSIDVDNGIKNELSGWHGFTDTAGKVTGCIPANTKLILRVISDDSCGNLLYFQKFTTSTINIALNDVIMPNSNTAFVTGSVANCINLPIINGYIILNKKGDNYRYLFSGAGTFSFYTILCNNNTAVNLIAENIDAPQQIATSSLSVSAGINNAGSLNACGLFTKEFINYTLDGINQFFNSPQDTLYQYIDPPGSPETENLAVFTISNNVINSVNIAFTRFNIGLNSSQNLLNFSINNTDSLRILNTINVNITEFGAIKDFISGNFSGMVISSPPLNIVHIVTCTFRVKRQQ